MTTDAHPQLQRRAIIENVCWLFADKVLRLGGGLVVGGLIARHLGPEQYGLWNYAIAFSSLFGACASLGLDSIMVREIVRNPQARAALLSTAFYLKLIAGILALATAAIAIHMVRPGETTALILVCLSGLGFVFQAAQVADFELQAGNNNRISVIAQNAAFLLMTIVKIVLLTQQAPLLAFAIAGAIEVALGMSFLLATFFWRGGRIDVVHANWTVARRLLADSWPLMLGGIAVSLYMRIDQVMLGAYLDDHSVGIYSAAVRISEAWYFIPMAISTALFPTIVKLKEANPTSYRNRMQQYFDVMFVLGLAAAIVVTLVGPTLVNTLYGPEYANAGRLLVLHSWAGIFVSLGVASSSWLATEGLQSYALVRTALGCVCNIGLNIILIPTMGAAGAVVGTLVAYGIATHSLILFPQTRTCGTMLVKALLPLRLIRRSPS